MAVQTAALELAAGGIAVGVTAVSLHTTDGSTTGSGELTGGAYTRETPSYAAGSSDGEYDIDTPIVFDGPAASSVVTHLGFWAGATWLGSAALAASKTLGPGDTLTVTSAPVVATAA